MPPAATSKAIRDMPRNRPALRSISLLVLAAVFGTISGYRLLGDGRDHLSYVDFYEGIQIFGQNDFSRFEPGLIWIASFFKLVLNAEIELLLVFLSAFSLLIKFAIFSEHRRPLLTILFYLCCWYPLHEYTQIRAAVAFAFIFLATEAFFKREFITFALFVAIGSLFHVSAILLGAAIIVAWTLASFRMSAIIVITFGLSTIVGILMQPILVFAERLNPLAILYAANLEGHSVNLFSAVNITTVALMTAILLARSLTDRRMRTFFILALFGFGAMVVFQLMPVFSHRFREMFLLFLVPLAFNARCTPLGLMQMSIAVILGGGSFIANVLEGNILT